MNVGDFTNLGSRLLWGLSSVAIVLSALYSLQFPLFHPIFAVLVALIAAQGGREFYFIARQKGYSPPDTLGAASIAGYVLAVYAAQAWHSPLLPSALLLLAHFLIFVRSFRNGQNAIANVSVASFGIFYLAYPMGALLQLAINSPSVDGCGPFWVLFVIATTKFGDTAAYFVGRSLGRTPLAPTLSPKKTIEGTAAALGGSLTAGVGLSLLGACLYAPHGPLPMFDAVVLGTLIGALGQLGDLAESALKRDAGVKDSNAIPGMGGFLDLLDSLLFTCPLVYVYLSMH
ncbi:MAG: phosphatidate cytidylyltransferase [Chlamydiia bacterium]|nr:phosphatidate cytidylyltransferase [Chlamydiia bacterium]